MRILKKNKKIYIVIVCAVILVCLLIFFAINDDKTGYKYLKEKKSENLVYTLYNRQTGDVVTEVPYINIKGAFAKTINDEIANFVSENLVGDNVIVYNYDLSGKILSLVIELIEVNEDYLNYKFVTYNLNLETKKILSDQEVLDLYNADEKMISSILESEFKNIYSDELKNKVFDNECDYKCFLTIRGINNYTDDVQYYVENSKLYAYKAFNIYSIYDEENYFTNDSFKFQLSE